MTDAMAVFQPDQLSGMMKAADQLARSSLIPGPLRNKPGDVLVVLLTGREFGIGPMQALRSIHVVDGKPTMSADLMVGLCLARREVCEYFTPVESTAQRATYKTKRTGSPEVSLTWTMEQAKAARVTGKDNWQKYPDAMLRARCASALARAVYPDLLAGTYDPDELDGGAGAQRSMPEPHAAHERATEAHPLRADSAATEDPSPSEAGAHEEPVPPAPATVVRFDPNPPTGVMPGDRPATVVLFGPHKGKLAVDLSDDELSSTIDMAHEKLMEQPRAKWAKAMREHLAALELDAEFRVKMPKPNPPAEPGAEG